MTRIVKAPNYTGPDRRTGNTDRRVGERRVRFDDVPMVIDRRRAAGDRRRTPDRRTRAALILNTPLLRRDDSRPSG